MESADCDVDMAFSSNRKLDILARSISKGSAARHLSQAWSYEEDQVIVCGDLGNDLAMIEQALGGIAVCNAHPEMRANQSQSVPSKRRICGRCVGESGALAILTTMLASSG